MIPINEFITLEDREVRFSFVQASGPGGQNVNKVATAAELRFDVLHSPALPEDVRARLMRLAGKRLTAEGELVIEAHSYRTQEQNRQAALDRLAALIQKACEQPKPRHKTRPTRAAIERRLDGKRRRSEVKRQRRSMPDQ